MKRETRKSCVLKTIKTNQVEGKKILLRKHEKKIWGKAPVVVWHTREIVLLEWEI